MKLKELATNENGQDNLVEFGGAFLRAATGRNFADMGGKREAAEKTFIQNFVNDAISGLKNAIDSGLVDPKAESSARQVDPASVQPDQEQSQQAQQGQQTQQGQQAQQRQSKANLKNRRNTMQKVNAYVKNVARAINTATDVAEKMKLTKEVINFMADRQNYPEWDNAKKAVQNIIQQSDIDPAFVGSAVKRLETGQTMTEAWNIYFINRLLEETGFTWEDFNLVVLKEGSNYYLAESTEYHFETMYESVLIEEEAQSIGDWVRNWFANYMQGVDYSKRQNLIDKLIDELKPPARKLKQGLTKLAKAAWAISVESGRASDPSERQPGQARVSGDRRDQVSDDPEELEKQVKDGLQQLAQVSPDRYKEIARQIQGQ